MEMRGNEEIGLVDLLKIHGTSENPEKNVGSPTPGADGILRRRVWSRRRTRTDRTRHQRNSDSVRTDLGTSSNSTGRRQLVILSSVTSYCSHLPLVENGAHVTSVNEFERILRELPIRSYLIFPSNAFHSTTTTTIYFCTEKIKFHLYCSQLFLEFHGWKGTFKSAWISAIISFMVRRLSRQKRDRSSLRKCSFVTRD